MERSIIGLLDGSMMFRQLEQVQRADLDACTRHDDNRDLRGYDFQTDGFDFGPDGSLRYLIRRHRPAAAQPAGGGGGAVAAVAAE
eukprot:SAG11_NODE_15946_length_561_cov_3.445887_1_plen_84_part_01